MDETLWRWAVVAIALGVFAAHGDGAAIITGLAPATALSAHPEIATERSREVSAPGWYACSSSVADPESSEQVKRARACEAAFRAEGDPAKLEEAADHYRFAGDIEESSRVLREVYLSRPPPEKPIAQPSVFEEGPQDNRRAEQVRPYDRFRQALVDDMLTLLGRAQAEAARSDVLPSCWLLARSAPGSFRNAEGTSCSLRARR